MRARGGGVLEDGVVGEDSEGIDSVREGGGFGDVCGQRLQAGFEASRCFAFHVGGGGE